MRRTGKNKLQTNLAISLVIGAGVAIAGYAILVSLAAGPAAKIEAEMASGANVISDLSASQGKALLFAATTAGGGTGTGGTSGGTGAGGPGDATNKVGYDTSSQCKETAAIKNNWGQPTYQSDFSGTTLDPTWHPYGPEPGHNNAGTRTPEAITVAGGTATINADGNGKTGAMKWFPGQQYGRWEVCMKVATGKQHHVLITWPDAEDWPVGGEIDFAEGDGLNSTDWFLHYGANNDQTSDSTNNNAGQWTAYAFEWTPTTMTGYINGNEWHKETDPGKFPPRPMNLCIQLDYFGNGGADAMSVDWTKQWALPESKPSTLGLSPGEPATGHPDTTPAHKPRPMTVQQMLP